MPLHWPLLQLSFRVQRSPSLHATPSFSDQVLTFLLVSHLCKQNMKSKFLNSNFLPPISFIAAHLCGSFLFLNNIHWSKYYSFQLIVNKQTNKSLSLNGGVPDKDFLACSDSLRNIFFGPPAVLYNIQAQLDSRCRHVFHRTGSCRAFLRTCHLNSGRLLSSDWCRCT